MMDGSNEIEKEQGHYPCPHGVYVLDVKVKYLRSDIDCLQRQSEQKGVK